MKEPQSVNIKQLSCTLQQPDSKEDRETSVEQSWVRQHKSCRQLHCCLSGAVNSDLLHSQTRPARVKRRKHWRAFSSSECDWGPLRIGLLILGIASLASSCHEDLGIQAFAQSTADHFLPLSESHSWLACSTTTSPQLVSAKGKHKIRYHVRECDIVHSPHFASVLLIQSMQDYSN